jgi:Na+/proline symporter
VAILAAAMSSVSSALTSLASVSTMDFVKKVLPGKSDAFFLRFSKASTVFWGAALILVASLSRRTAFVLETSFTLRGLTSGALLGGLILALSWKRGKPLPVILGMLCSLAVMAWISPLVQPYLPPKWPRLSLVIAFPWYTMIGCGVTVLVAVLARRLLPPSPKIGD